MANLIDAIANACGQTAVMVKAYMDGVHDAIKSYTDRMNGRLDLMPTYDDIKSMSQYKLLGEGDGDHNVTVTELVESGRYKIFTNASSGTSQVNFHFYEPNEGMTFTEAVALGSGASLPFHTFELLGVAREPGQMRYILEVNGEEHDIVVSLSSGVPELQKVTFTGVDSVYLFTLGTEVVVKDGKSVHVRYSAHADGTDFTEAWSEGKQYIGIATGVETPTDKGEYTWVKFMGKDGVDRKLYCHNFTMSDLDPNDISRHWEVSGTCYTSSPDSLVGKWPPVGTILYGTFTDSPTGTGYYDFTCIGRVLDDATATIICVHTYMAPPSESWIYPSETISSATVKIATDSVTEV